MKKRSGLIKPERFYSLWERDSGELRSPLRGKRC